jgi:hypothetical protein
MATFLETREFCPFLKEVDEGPIQVLERVLQGLRGSFFEPRELFFQNGSRLAIST